MALRIGEMVWDSLEELKELEAIVQQAIREQEREDKYFDHLSRTVKMTKMMCQTAQEVKETITLFNPKTGETMRINPTDIILATTPVMVEWEKETTDEF